MARILIVDDEPSILNVLTVFLCQHEHEVIAAGSAKEALELLAEKEVDAMLVDLRLGPGLDGLELLHECLALRPNLPAIMMTAYGTIEVAVQAMREGADDFICKPFDLKALHERLETILRRTMSAATAVGENGLPARHFGQLVGESEEMQRLYALIERVSRTDATVLIQGESGTGKELVAQAIHASGPRAQRPWVPLNCAAIPDSLLESEMFGHAAGAFTGATGSRDGLFMEANGGTLFLDEIGVMDFNLQGKLLRALQEGKVRRVGENRDLPVDVRVVAATNEPLEQKRDAGLFREDLYYRISVIPVHIPPLRHRKEDIPLLLAHCCDQQQRQLQVPITVAAGVLEELMAYPWPGNVREFQNAIACAAALCQDGVIRTNDLPPHVGRHATVARDLVAMREAAGATLGKTLREFLREKEQLYMELVLERTGGNRARAADLLGISRATFYRKFPEVAGAEREPPC